MTKNPTISTIIPTYNRGNLIASTIESVLKQSYKSHEIIVVDDGSTDNTLDVLKQYGNEIKIIQKENGGSASARNLGIEHSSGDYIAYLDSDDTWHPDKLATFVNYIAICKDPYNLFMFSDFRRFDMDKNELLPLSQTQIYPIIYDYFHKIQDCLYSCEGIELLQCVLKPYPFYPSTFLLSRKIHNSFLWTENSIFCEDFDLVLRLYKQSKFYYVDKSLSTMGMHDSNLTWQTNKKLQGDIDAIKSYSRTIGVSAIEKKICNHEIGKRYWAFGQYLRNEKNYISAICCYINGLLYFENVKRLIKISLTRITSAFR